MTRDDLVDAIIAAVWQWIEPKHQPDEVTRLYVQKRFLPLVDRYVAERENAVRSELADQFYVASGVEATEFDVAGKLWTPADLVAAIRKQMRPNVEALAAYELAQKENAERERRLVELALELARDRKIPTEAKWVYACGTPSVDDVLAEFKRREGK